MSIWWTAAGFIHLIGATCFFFSLCFCVCWWCFQILFWNSVAALKQFHGNPTLQKTTVILRISPTARTSPTLSKTPCFLIFRGKNIFLLFFEYKIMTDLETNSLHSGVYIAWLWQCLQWAMAISIPWPRLEGLNSQILGDPLMIDCYCYSQFQDVPNHVLGGRPCHVHHCDPRSHGPGEELFKMYQC